MNVLSARNNLFNAVLEGVNNGFASKTGKGFNLAEVSVKGYSEALIGDMVGVIADTNSTVERNGDVLRITW